MRQDEIHVVSSNNFNAIFNMKGYFPNNIYKKNLVYGVFEDDELCGAFETETEAQGFVDSLQNEENNNHEYKIIYHE